MEELKTELQTEEKPKPKAEPKTAKRTEAKKEPDAKRKKGVWVYTGPNLKGLVQSGSVYRGSREDALKALEGAVKEKPEVKTLLVSGEALGEARRKIRTPGNALYEAYKKAGRKAGGKN